MPAAQGCFSVCTHKDRENRERLPADTGSFHARVPSRSRLSAFLARVLLAAIAVAAPVAYAVAPVLSQEQYRYSWLDDNAGDVQIAWRLPENTTVTKHQYRYTVWNREVVPSSWTRNWTDIPLADTNCNVVTNPGMPTQTSTSATSGAACATTGTNAALHYNYWTNLSGFTGGLRYRFELRAVNNDGDSDAVMDDFALPADPDGIVTILDPNLESRVRARINEIYTLDAADPITQLRIARVPTLFVHTGAITPANRIRSLSGLEYAINMEHIIAYHHSFLTIPEVERMHQLRIFNNHGSLLSDLAPLRNLINLERLYLNRGRTFPPEGVCTGTPDGPDHGASAWAPSASCAADRVDDVVVRDLTPLRRLTKLHTLWLCDQRANPDHLTPLVNMEYMSFCRNNISDISGMSGLTKMKDLYLFENRIEDVSPLGGLSELRMLQLHGNAIRDISSLSSLTKLTHIYLSDNPLDAGSCSTAGGVLLPQHTTRTACGGASGVWTTNVVSTLAPLAIGSCSVTGTQPTEAACLGASGTWTAGTLKLIDLRGDTQLSDADVSALSSITGVTVLHDADIRPAAPTGLSATTTGRTVALTWTDPSNAAIAAYQYRYREGTGDWSDWQETNAHDSAFHHWARSAANQAALSLTTLPGGTDTLELRAMVASDYGATRTRNADGTSFTTIKTHSTAVTAANVGAGQWEVGRVLTPGPSASVTVSVPAKASIASTSPEALTELNLNNATVTVELSGATFNASIGASSFELTTAPATIGGLTIASVSRISDTQARLTLGFDGTDFTLRSTLAVRALAAATSASGNLDTPTVPVAPTVRLQISERSLALTEGGALEAYSVRLTGQPSATVSVAAVASTSSDLSYQVSGSLPFLFTTMNWNTARAVNVRAGEDDDAVDDMLHIGVVATTTAGGDAAATGLDTQTAMFENGTATSLAGCERVRAFWYACPGSPRVLVTVDDDESHFLTVSTPTSVAEGGALRTYTVRVATQPTGPVTVTIASSDSAVSVDTDTGTAGDQDSLLFTTTNWNTARNVTVTAGEDDDAQNEFVTLTHSASGADYDSVMGLVTFTVTDNDTRGATLFDSAGVGMSGTYLVYEDSTRHYTLRLDTEPVGGDVTVAVASSSATTATVNPSSLTFTAGNWAVPQAVTITGVADADTTNDNVTISHTVTGADYGGIVTINNLAAQIVDTDVAGLTVAPGSLSVAEGATATYTVRLSVAPTAAVTVTVSGATAKLTVDTDTDTTGDQTTLSFNATNWNTAQTVTVTGVADDDGEDVYVPLNHAVAGTGNYASLGILRRPGISVRVRDDETPAVVVEPTSLTFDEGGEARYDVKLSAPPATGTATVSVAAAGTATLNVNTATALTFNATNWNTAKSVTVASVADHARLSDATATLRHPVTGYGSVTTGPEVTVRVRNTTVNYDSDVDGLIEITTPAQLNAMRWDLDGDGTASTGDETTYAEAFPNQFNGAVCPASGTPASGVACAGYELAANLDLDTDGDGSTWTGSGSALRSDDGDDYHNDGAGWEPIGTDANRFATVFRGNGRTINNLFVNRGPRAGLFGATDTTARIESVGVRNARVVGSSLVGILAGEARGDIVASYVSGTAGSPTATSVGGMVGRLRGDITASYSAATVQGRDQVGGLVGFAAGASSQMRTVSGSYAVGPTSADASVERPQAGGLVGRVSPILPASAVTAPDSYFDTDTTAQAQSARGQASSRTALQSPTGYTGIYQNWNMDLDGDGQADDPWNFGTSSHFPRLRWPGFNVALQVFPDARPVGDEPTSADATEVRAQATAQGLLVTWQAIAGATAYRVQWRTPGQAWSSSRQAETTRRRYEIEGLDDGTYEVRIVPLFDGVAGTPSAPVEVEAGTSGNRPPRAQRIADMELDVRETEEIDLDAVFDDPDDDSLRYTARTSGSAVEARVSGSTLRLRGLRPGEATVTATATDPSGQSASVSFTVLVGAVLSLRGNPALPEGGTATLEARLSRSLDSDVEIRWRLAADDDPATADADEADFDAAAGMATIAAGETRVRIAVTVRDDDDIEPARERIAVELQRPDKALALSTTAWRAFVTVQEGVCDRTPQVRAELARGWRACHWPRQVDLTRRTTLNLRGKRAVALQADDLLGLSRLRTLDLGRNALQDLPAGLLRHSPRLVSLRLDGNRLESLPAGLLAGLSGLRELRLAGNPGAPFPLAPQLRRTDAEPWAAGPATLEAALPLGAPFAMRLALSVAGGEASVEELTLAAGAVASGAVRVSGSTPTRVLLAAPTIPTTRCGDFPCFDGLAAEGSTLALFVTPPRILREIAAADLLGDADTTRIDLSRYVRASAHGGALAYSATVDNPLLATATVDGAILTVTSNEDDEEGTAVVTVVATDEAGQTATLQFEVEISPRSPGRWRGWRSTIASPQ